MFRHKQRRYIVVLLFERYYLFYLQQLILIYTYTYLFIHIFIDIGVLTPIYPKREPFIFAMHGCVYGLQRQHPMLN